MTKQTYRQAKRLQPLGEAGIAAVRKIVADHQYAKVNEVMVDAFSASAILAVYDALSPENRAKLVAFPVAKVADISFKLIRRTQS